MKIRKISCLVLACMLLALPAMAIEWVDANGRNVSVENPQRVVSLYHSYGDAWLLSGGELVGTIEDAFESDEISADDGIANLGSHTNPNMELLFSLNPDFVLLSSSVASQIEIGEILDQAGIPCAYFDTPDWRSYMENIRLFTSITGREDLYERQVNEVQYPIEAFIAEAEQNSEHYRQTTALLLRANSTGVRAKNSETTVAGNILRDMGFVNIADGESALSENLSMESILISDPDWIFLITGGSDTEAAMASLRASLTDHPAWSTLTAVREGRFIVLDRELFHYHPNDRWAESYAFIADLIKGEITG